MTSVSTNFVAEVSGRHSFTFVELNVGKNHLSMTTFAISFSVRHLSLFCHLLLGNRLGIQSRECDFDAIGWSPRPSKHDGHKHVLCS